MLNTCKLILLFVLATVFHWAFASLFARWGINANLMLVFVTVFCVLLKPPFAYSAAFLGGLFLDFFGTKLFGNNAFCFTLCACIICGTVDRFDFDELFPQMVAVFCLTWLVGLLNVGLVYLFTSSNMWPGFWSLFGGSVVDAICAPFVFRLVRHLLGNSSVCRQG